MVYCIGAFFWVLALAAGWRLWHLMPGPARRPVWPWLGVAAAGLLLLARPHEDVFGGEDPGSYLNSGISYGRHASLVRIDPLLAQVPPAVRPAFYYGHAGYGLTKDACLWVLDPERALVGSHFQPAYPILIAVLTRAAGPRAALYVVPLFGLLTALALGAIAARLLPHRHAGWLAAGLYLLHPLTLWHARGARPEILAGFMVFSGLALLLAARQDPPRTRWPDILVGALCLGAAPLFHVTAWLAVIPLAVACGILALAFRADFLIGLPAGLSMAWLHYLSVRDATDYYGLKRFFDSAISAWPWLALAAGAAAAAAWIFRRSSAVRPRPHPPAANFARTRFWPFAAAALTAGWLVFCWRFRDRISMPGWAAKLVANHHFITDWQTFANMVSPAMAWATLAGWLFWMAGARGRRAERAAAGLLLLPALSLVGPMRDFMMTRYLMIAVVPMAALCLAALAVAVPESPARRWTRWVAPALAALLAASGLAHRTHLAAVVEHRGFLRFLEPFARAVTGENGVLLGEYSRITAPMEHVYGVPALGLDNERKDDYRAAEKAWEAIMRRSPDRPAFFATPFQPPRSARFSFEPVLKAVFTNLDLHQARSALPTRIEAWPLPYALYRMRPAPAEPPAERRLTNDLELAIGPGNMGWRGFSRVRVERPEPAADPIPDAPETPAGPVTGRWARADAGFVLPGGSHGEVWLLLYAPDAGKPAPRLSLSAGADWTPESALQPDRWQWLRFPLPAGGLKADTWIAMRTDPAWNSRVPGFPDDLGVFVGRILVRPPPGGGRAAPGSARRTRR